jgi:hypothetical protein
MEWGTLPSSLFRGEAFRGLRFLLHFFMLGYLLP